MNPAELLALAEGLDLSDGDIADDADRLADQVRQRVGLWQQFNATEEQVFNRLRQFTRSHYVTYDKNHGVTELINRMSSAPWWRRQLRVRFRFVEQAERLRGAVHDKASRYVSPKALRRRDIAARRLAEQMAAMQAVNLDTGQTIGLDELVAASQSNPANRRAAMMVRIKGIEASARAAGHEAIFLTITAPSRMHLRHRTGAPVAGSDGATPRQVHAYLCRLWQNAMRKAAHLGMTAYGLRIVEPHHDGCPHWHVLAFTTPADAAPLAALLRAYALADSPDEPGAAEHRFTVENIDPAKGSAVGYVAKYVSKSIDGQGVDEDRETGATGSDAARGVVTWARLWGIRQFQFFGLPPITPVRELYRHDGQSLGSAGLIEVHRAVKANDYAAVLQGCKEHGVGLGLRFITRPSTRYPGELTKAIHGLVASAADLHTPLELTTRTETWVIEPRPAQAIGDTFGLPWTRINKSAPLMHSTTYGRPSEAATRAIERRPAGRQRGGHRGGPQPPGRPADRAESTRAEAC
jgi:hypothetical protein